MYIASTSIIAPCDFLSKHVSHIVGHLPISRSSFYIATLDRQIKADSMLGLLSANIKKNDTICLQVANNNSQEQADTDLQEFMKIVGDINGQ